ncbi:autotransporter outer membrane beta-barrel domain-containing protein [Allopusillimonas soli]|uniref:Autotransporter outer membrane beta-barrel domain-containing protein n=1 Tax=Allopusillimonas soli TaxID=659016 RepID=A0A853FCN0_9BURK|nr:autotransporter outer membrane beta-barrel domain-containing protein [Allopusillimonas soli]NYT35816.1 autotransporter outer membrane beta-barrel domain-containing protein [Allopusillimonas soli]TEA76189.1 autotransporter outer membrane beta-barrel domain-containing protein [Allopusillimonas soli]
MKQTNEQSYIRRCHVSSHSVSPPLVLRPLVRALGRRGHILLCVSGALLPLAAAHADLGYDCKLVSGIMTCSLSAPSPLSGALTLSNLYLPQQITNTASFDIGDTGLGKVTTDLGSSEEMIYGGEPPLNGIMVESHGADGDDYDSDHRDGQDGQGAMLITSGSVSLSLGNSTPSGMVTGVGVSSVGGDGYNQSDHKENGGNGGNAGSTTLKNSSAVTITGGILNSGVTGALVESRGGNGGADYTDFIDYYGGNGGNTQSIEMDNYADVKLGSSASNLQGGTRAWGVAAQAVGGNGSFHATGHGKPPMGVGGAGADISFLNTGNVDVFLTQTSDAPDGVVGLLARSMGGDGGETTWKYDDGGAGGDSGFVTMTVGHEDLSAVTNINVGVNQSVSGTSAGILAQSIAGNGGSMDSDGGYGGNGGNAGGVTTNLYWVNLSATGDGVAGVTAYSRGGYGGSDSEDSYRVDGGNGGLSHDVTVTLQSKGSQDGQQTSVSTTGAEAIGIAAQSIGGYGGSAVKEAGIGQDGAQGKITADANSIVSTQGDYSIGMLAQSIGGGGGTGQDFTSSLPGGSGKGGNGGDGANAMIASSATVTTQGQYAHGMVAQSIGGSGGAGAMSDSLVSLGGAGGAGGTGGTVSISGASNVSTSGESAIGVIAQSIGGGGGSAGSASGLFSVGGSVNSSQSNDANSVSVAVNSVDTKGDGSIGILAQSIGGSGGNGGSAAGITAVGGSGSSGGSGGQVTVDVGTNISTIGEYALGVVAQSVGGGGGNGGSTLAISPGEPVATASIGGSAGAAGSGGKVTVQSTMDGTISTSGDGSIAVLAQSLGGGGGNGGSAELDGVQTPVTLVVGGKAGGGGGGGEVDATLSHHIVETQGIAAAGVIAQSIGGGGGNGGAAHNYTANVGIDIGVAVGGNGGNGGSGGIVNFQLDDMTISTAGVGSHGSNQAGNASIVRSDSYGIVAQSVGGGGGNGGSALDKSVVVAAPNPDGGGFAISSNVAVGGSGGEGGDGGNINVDLLEKTAIFTGGQGSHAVVAQSIGGGGGNGGGSNAMSTDVSIPTQSVDISAKVAVGGTGGSGGLGGNVNLAVGSSALIVTFDDTSNGILAQSIGGGGGNAGAGSSSSGGLSQGKTYSVSVGVGGGVGSGNVGGNIAASLDAGSVIQTYGSGSRGVVMHSVGGGGGAAQGTTVDLGGPVSVGGGSSADQSALDATNFSAAVGVSVGATGGSGGDGGSIKYVSQGSIATVGGDADGVLIQSIGGGGGLGGNAGADASAGPSSYKLPTTPDNPPPPSNDTNLGKYSLSVAVGGSGGASGKGGSVEVDYAGSIFTKGDHADAMVAQSIGGGGGVGGASTAKGAKGSSQAVIAVGGSGGAAGSGGNITLNMTSDPSNSQGTLYTVGDESYGLLAQSIGGGGGQGAVGSDIITKSTVKNPSIVLGWGGSGGNGGNGGTVNMNASNSGLWVYTSGYDSHGVVLQSIGGGGGTAAMSGASLSGTANNPQLKLQMGGGGRSGDSNGGDINVDSWMNINTTGDHAFGFVAQSIGGGGGIMSAGPGANVQSVNLAAPYTGSSQHGGNLTIALGNNDAGSASSDESPSAIATTGRGSHGMVLQSIAGGGGIGGDTANGPLALGWQDGVVAPSSGQVSGDISLTMGSGSTITTIGDGAYGVIAQSLSAPGGLGGNSTGSFAGTLSQAKGGSGGVSGGITMEMDGTVQVQGKDAWGVFAQTYDTESSMPKPVDITISGNLTGGTEASGPETGGAVWIDSPAASTITINTGGAVDGSQGYAAVQQTGSGSTSIVNHGSLKGNLVGKAASADSASSASLAVLGKPIFLSNFGTFSSADLVQGDIANQGHVFIGEPVGSDTMQVTGDFIQRSQGVLHVATDFVAKTTDLLSVGGRAQLDGKISIAASTLMPDRELTFLQAGILTPRAAVQGESPLFTYKTRQAGNSLNVSVDAAKFNEVSESYGVGSNLHALGQHLQDVWDRGSDEKFGTMFAALNRSAGKGSVSYANALNDLSLGVLAAPAALKQAGMISFSNSLLSCPGFKYASTRMGEHDCVWGRVSGNTTQMDSSGGTSGLKSDGVLYQMGAQRSIAPNWFVGVAGAYEHTSLHADDDRQHIKGDSGYLGVSLKYEDGPWTFAGALTGSYGSFDNTRNIDLMGVQAESDSRVISIGQRLRASYTHAMDRSYIKPFIDLDVMHTHMPSFDERGAGALNLHVEGVSKWSAIISPGVELGGRIDLKNGYILRPYASAEVSLSNTDKWDSRARFASAPTSADPFTSTLETGRVFGQVSAGIQVLSGKGMDVKLQYDGLLSSKVSSHSGSVKATWRF